LRGWRDGKTGPIFGGGPGAGGADGLRAPARVRVSVAARSPPPHPCRGRARPWDRPLRHRADARATTHCREGILRSRAIVRISVSTAPIRHVPSISGSCARGSNSTARPWPARVFVPSAYREVHTRGQHHVALTCGMTFSQPARRSVRARGRRVAGLVVLTAAISAAGSSQSPASATAPTPPGTPGSLPRTGPAKKRAPGTPPRAGLRKRRAHPGAPSRSGIPR
jgi:hypothetical protein